MLPVGSARKSLCYWFVTNVEGSARGLKYDGLVVAGWSLYCLSVCVSELIL